MQIEISADALFARIGQQQMQLEAADAEIARLRAEIAALKAVPTTLPESVRERLDAVKSKRELNGDLIDGAVSVRNDLAKLVNGDGA